MASAAVLIPFALASAWFGGWWFVLMCGVAALAILWEWTLLVAGRADWRILAPGLAALMIAVVCCGEGRFLFASAAIVTGAFVACGLTAAGAKPAKTPPALWSGAGVLYAGVAVIAPIVMRSDPGLGLTALIFLFAVVWATDICAYVVGRALGGALLWPRVSPKKTWAGALGGWLGGVAAGILVAYASGEFRLVTAALLASLLSIVTQGGDLLESAIKRRFGAKDAGTLIPGHGGVMDRLDGFLVAVLVAVLIGVVRGGMTAPARGFLVW
jgi:phosphatidate cytidylyltransferase